MKKINKFLRSFVRVFATIALSVQHEGEWKRKCFVWCWQRHQDSTEWGAWNKRPETQTNDIVEHYLLHNVPNDTRIFYHSDWGLAVSRDGKIKSCGADYLLLSVTQRCQCFRWRFKYELLQLLVNQLLWVVRMTKQHNDKMHFFSTYDERLYFYKSARLADMEKFHGQPVWYELLNSYFITLSVNQRALLELQLFITCLYVSSFSILQLSAILASTAARWFCWECFLWNVFSCNPRDYLF